MHGPFTWRKLIAGKKAAGAVVVGPTDPCVCENQSLYLTCDLYATTYTYSVCFSIPTSYELPIGVGVEYDDLCYTVTAQSDCNAPPDVPVTFPIITPNCPQERLLEFGLPCNRPFVQTTNSSACVNWATNPGMGVVNYDADPNTYDGYPNPYYYLPDGETGIRSTLLCVNYGSVSESHRRLQLISGRNRDRYGGPICAFYRKGYDPSCGVEGEEWKDIIAGLTHIGYQQSSISRGSGAGQSRFGGTFPMEDGVLDLPLFGALTRSNRSDPNCTTINPCCDSHFSEAEGNCFDCRPAYNNGGSDGNEGYGHFLPRDRGSTSGYFSFGCFNPQSMLYSRLLNESSRGRLEFPASSLWAYIKGIRDYIYNVERAYEENANQVCADLPELCECGATAADINWANGTNDGESWWINTDPGGTNSAGTSNVRLILDELERRVEKIRVYDVNNENCNKLGEYQLITPKVFLWDKDAFLGATAANRWKHIYTIGYSNILWDSGCTNTPANESSVTGSDNYTLRNELIYVDNISHAVGASAANAVRLLGWVGCNGDPAGGSFITKIRAMQCNGEEYGSPPSSEEFDCTDCRKDLSPRDCFNAFWRGYDDSVTACPNYEVFSPCPGGLTASSVASAGGPHAGIVYSQGNGNWGAHGKEGKRLFPPSTETFVEYGSGNGFAPTQGTVLRMGSLVGGSQGGSPMGTYPYAVAIKTDNKLQQWGGQRIFTSGDGGKSGTLIYTDTTPTNLFLKFPPTSVDVSKVATGLWHGLALKTDGGLTAWGLSGTAGNNQKAVINAPSSGTYISIAAGGFAHSCYPSGNFDRTSVSGAVTNTGQLVTWGDNDWGQVDANVPSNPYRTLFCGSSFNPQTAILPRPTSAELSAEGGCTAVVFGVRAAGAITNSPDNSGNYQYKVKVWGWRVWNNENDTVNFTNVPENLTDVKQLVILDPYCCVALLNDGNITGWGTIQSPSSTFRWGWEKLLSRGIEDEKNVAEIAAIANEGVLVRRNDGTMKVYWCVNNQRFSTPYC